MNVLPVPTFAIGSKFLKLGIGGLIDGGHTGVNDDGSFAHKIEVARLRITLAAFQWANDRLEPG